MPRYRVVGRRVANAIIYVNSYYTILRLIKRELANPELSLEKRVQIGLVHICYVFFLLFKGVKSLYFLYSIVNFTALNLQGITSLHLLTSRVGLLLLKLVRLFLQTTGVA